MNFVVLCSSRGTTLQAVLERLQEKKLTARCFGVIADKPERGCLEKAKAFGIPSATVEKLPDEPREAYDKRLHQAILGLAAGRPVDVIAALGWMFVLSPWFIHKWKRRIINVHPALLPKFGGKGMYGLQVHQAVLDAKEHETGITIHLMDEGIDTGDILLQKTCPVLPGDTAEVLRDRVQTLEREWYPWVLQQIKEGILKVGT